MNLSVHRLIIDSKRSVRGLLDGLWRSHYKGRGIDFEELKMYEPGDPVSDISWAHLAAWNRLLIKKYREERNLSIWILFDLSPSIFALGPKRRERMAEIAALISLAALDQRDKVGLLFFTSHLEKLVLPRKGLGAAPYLLQELLTLEGTGTGTDWEIPFSYLSKTDPKGGSIVFLLSDFATLPKESSLLKLNLKSEVVGIFVEEQLEEVAPPKGILYVEDAESGQVEAVDTTSNSFHKEFLERQSERKKSLEHLFGKAGGSLLMLPSNKDPLSSLVSFLKQRKR